MSFFSRSLFGEWVEREENGHAHLAVSWQGWDPNDLFPLKTDFIRAEVTDCEQKHRGMLPRVLWLDCPQHWEGKKEREIL